MQLNALFPATLGLVAVVLATPQPKSPAVVPRLNANEYINYTTLTGFFLQDEPTTVPGTFDYSTVNFGLINRTYPTDGEISADSTQWQKFDHYVWRLNRQSGRFVQYKVLYLGRHGEGYHNVAESYYGTPAWNCYWSIRDGNGTTTWADARITPNGVAQAVKANKFWASHIKNEKLPAPESYYTSPLTRCLQTANITFSGLDLSSRHPFIPTVKELFREGISGHTCDRRGTKTYIEEAFPDYVIEAGFSETDLLWKPLLSETSVDEDIRSKTALDEVFNSDDSTYISVTSHSGEIASILSDLGHQSFGLSTGQVIPVLVKAETIKAAPIVTATQPYTPISTCSTQPPLPTAT